MRIIQNAKSIVLNDVLSTNYRIHSRDIKPLGRTNAQHRYLICVSWRTVVSLGEMPYRQVLGLFFYF